MPHYKFPSRPASVDDDEVAVEKVPRAVLQRSIKKARSLNPGPKLVEAFARGDREAIAVAFAWKPSWKVRILPAAEYAELISRTEGITFHGA